MLKIDTDAERIMKSFLPGDITPEEIALMALVLEMMGLNGRDQRD